MEFGVGYMHRPLVHRYQNWRRCLKITGDVLDAEYQGELTHAFTHFKVFMEPTLQVKCGLARFAPDGMWRPIDRFQKGVAGPHSTSCLMVKDIE